MDLQQNTILLAEIGDLERRIQCHERLKTSLPEKANAAKLNASLLEAKYNILTESLKILIEKRKTDEQVLTVERSNRRKWEKRAEEIQGERAYSSLMSEISSQKKLISETEDRVLQLMQEIENAESQAVKLKEAAEQSAQIAVREWENVKESIARLDLELDTMKSSIKKHLEQLHPTLKIRYERVSAGRQGLGIAFLEKEVCQCCRQMVPPELFLRVLKAEVIEQCPSCQRILVVKTLTAIDVIGVA